VKALASKARRRIAVRILAVAATAAWLVTNAALVETAARRSAPEVVQVAGSSPAYVLDEDRVRATPRLTTAPAGRSIDDEVALASTAGGVAPPVATARSARRTTSASIAEALGWDASGRDARDLDRWLERSRADERAMLDSWGGAGRAPAGGAAAFNRAAAERERQLVERFGRPAADHVARRAALRRVDETTGEIVRVDLDGRRIPGGPPKD